MMLVKTYPGDGVVELYEAHDDVRFLGAGCKVEAPVGDAHWSANDDDLFPSADVVHAAFGKGAQAAHTVGVEGDERRAVLVGWCFWRDPDGTSHLLVFDGRTFLMNEDGQTVEVLE